MKNILIINGHPYGQSFNHAIGHAYLQGVQNSSAAYKEIFIADLNFNPVLGSGYHSRTELEPDLMDAWEKIKWANHIVMIFPVWWGGMPGNMKSFFDRLFLPGMAFQYRENSVFWDKLLSGKTGHIIATMDSPLWYFRIFYRSHAIMQLKKSIMTFCGIRPVKVTIFPSVKQSTPVIRQKWLTKIERFGKENK